LVEGETEMKRPYCNASRHGTYTAYHKAGCRCDDARDDYNRYRARWAEGPAEDLYVPSLGARRRVQALVAIGYTYQAIGNASGVRMNTVCQIATGRSSQIRPDTATKIVAAFEALSRIPGGHRDSVKRARKLGWAPPGMWRDIDDPGEEMDCAEDPDLVDEVLVERVVKGWADAGELNDAEKHEAARQLLAKGWTHNRVAVRLNWNIKTARKVAA
jgi:hypothetical protein